MSAPFQLLGGHPALDLVNTLGNRFVAAGTLELLPSYADLLRFARQSQILSATQAAALEPRAHGAAANRVLHSVHGLREALAALLYPNGAALSSTAALKAIQRQVLRAGAQQELRFARPPKRAISPAIQWSWGCGEKRLELPLWILAKSAEQLLTQVRFAQVRSCQRDSCRWLFLDGSKNHSRRWCDMKICGNRVKAQRFHAQHG